MAQTLGAKATNCLLLAADHSTLSFAEWQARYDELCEWYSEKAVARMYESLADRGYTDYGVSARMCWLTDKGREALRQATDTARAHIQPDESREEPPPT